MQLTKNMLYMLLISTQISETISFSDQLTYFYNRYRHQSTIVQLIIPAALFSAVSVGLYCKYVYAPQINAGVSKVTADINRLSQSTKTPEEAQKSLQIAQETASETEKYRKKKHQALVLQKNEFEKKLQKKITKQQAHQTFFGPLKKYQSEKLNTVLSTVSKDSITTLYKNAGEASVLIIPKEILEIHKEDLLEILPQYNITLGGWLKSQWKKALEDQIKQSSSSQNDPDSIPLEKIPPLVHDAKIISKAFVPPHEISTFDQKQYFITKNRSAYGRIFTYIKLKTIIEQKKLSHIRLPLKFLIIKNEQTNEYITDKQTIEPLLDQYTTMELNYASRFGTITCLGPYFLDLTNTYDTAILAEKITDSGKKLNADAFDELKQLIQEAPFDVGRGNIFTDAKGDAIIIDTEFKGESADQCIAKLNRYR